MQLPHASSQLSIVKNCCEESKVTCCCIKMDKWGSKELPLNPKHSSSSRATPLSPITTLKPLWHSSGRFIHRSEAAVAWCETDRGSGSEGHYQTSHRDIAGIAPVIDLSPEASVKAGRAVQTWLQLAGGRPRSGCHLVCIQSEGVWCIMATRGGLLRRRIYIQTSSSDWESFQPQLQYADGTRQEKTDKVRREPGGWNLCAGSERKTLIF